MYSPIAFHETVTLNSTLNFFLVGKCGLDFRTWGLCCGQTNCHDSKGLWADFHQKRGQIRASEAKYCLIFWKIVDFGGKILHLSFKWESMNELKPQLGVLWTAGEREKGVLRAAHPYTPFSGECPPPWDTDIYLARNVFGKFINALKPLWMFKNLFSMRAANRRANGCLWHLTDAIWLLERIFQNPFQ